MRELVDEDREPRVGLKPIGDDDPLGFRCAVPVAAIGGLKRDPVADLLREVDERGDELLMRGARDLATRCLERGRLRGWGQWRDLVLGLSRDSTDRIRSLCASDDGGVGWRGGSVRG